MGQPIPEDAPRPGALLAEALGEGPLPSNVTVKPVECLSNCGEGCSIVLRGGDARWTYVYGRLDPSMAEVVRDGTEKYAATPDGLVPWRERPQHFRKNCIARIPPIATPVPSLSL